MLPYKNILEAQEILGRNLTAAESLWFRYTANKPDFILYYHNIFFLFFVYTFVPLPITLLDLSGWSYINRFKLQPKETITAAAVFRCYKAVIHNFIIAMWPLQIVSFPVIVGIGTRFGLPLPSIWEMAAQLTLYFVMEDYLQYWFHRAMHSKWGYEKIHKVHHEFSSPVAYAAVYARWSEVCILGLPSFVGPLIAPGHVITFSLWMVLRHIEAIDSHSGYDFPYSPTRFIPFYGGADFHDYHHCVGSQTKCNFASVFTYCDYIYGTDKGYRYHKSQLVKMRAQLKRNEANGEEKYKHDKYK